MGVVEGQVLRDALERVLQTHLLRHRVGRGSQGLLLWLVARWRLTLRQGRGSREAARFCRFCVCRLGDLRELLLILGVLAVAVEGEAERLVLVLHR